MSNGFSMLTCICAAAPVAAESGRTIQQCCNPKPVLACFAARQHKIPPSAVCSHTSLLPRLDIYTPPLRGVLHRRRHPLVLLCDLQQHERLTISCAPWGYGAQIHNLHNLTSDAIPQTGDRTLPTGRLQDVHKGNTCSCAMLASAWARPAFSSCDTPAHARGCSVTRSPGGV